MLEVGKVSPQSFKAAKNPTNGIYQQMVSVPQGADSFEKQSKKKERWYKTGVAAQVGLAVAFGVIALTGLLTHKLQRKTTAAQIKELAAQEEYFKNQNKPKEKVEDVLAKAWENLENAIGLEDMALSKDMEDLLKKVENNINNPEIVLAKGGVPIKSIILYGPPGTGKTTFAKALAKRFKGSKFATLDVTKMKDKYVGETEKNVNAVIDGICEEADKAAAKYKEELEKVIGKDVVARGNAIEIQNAIKTAKAAGKTIPVEERFFVFADEIDSVMMVDSSSSAKFSNDVLNEFKKGFTEKLGKRKNIITIGATNLQIDAEKAMTTDGKLLDKPMLDRFQKKILVDNPNAEQLKKTIINHYKNCSAVSKELKEASPKLDMLCDFLADKEHRTSFRTIESIFGDAGDAAAGSSSNLKIDDIVQTIKGMKESMNVSDAELTELINKLNTVTV